VTENKSSFNGDSNAGISVKNIMKKIEEGMGQKQILWESLY